MSIKDKTKELFLFVCPNCGHEFSYKFTDEEIEIADGFPIEITSSKCEKCNEWVKPIKKS